MCSDELEAASPAKFLTVTKGLLVLPALPAATAAQREGCVLELSVWVCNRSVCAAKWLLQQCSNNSKCVNKPKACCCPTSLLQSYCVLCEMGAPGNPDMEELPVCISLVTVQLPSLCTWILVS